MTDDQLHDAIFADPTVKDLADRGDDAGAARLVPALLPPVPYHGEWTEKGIAKAFPDPVAGITVLVKIQAAADAGQPLLKYAAKWLDPSRGGLDFGDPTTRGELDMLAGAGVLTAEEVAVLKALGEQAATVSADDVSRVWLQHRPNGRIAG